MDDQFNTCNSEERENNAIEPVPAIEQPSGEKPKSKKGIWALLGGLLVVLGKFKFILLFLFGKLKFLFIFLKLGKFLTTFGSMLLMIVVYAQMYGWAFGIGFVLLLFIHEMGHFLTAKGVGLKVSAPLFIPFVGAFISMKEQPQDAVTESKVAAGGPILGSIGALVALAFYPMTGQKMWLALAYTGFLLNLFNLIPFHPLDGGRIVSAISPKMWFVGVPIILVAAIKWFNPILIFLLILGIAQIYQHWKSPNHEYYNTPFKTRLIFALLYFGMIGILGVGMAGIYGMIKY